MKPIGKFALVAGSLVIAVSVFGAATAPRADAASTAKQIKKLQKAVKALQRLTTTQKTQIASLTASLGSANSAVAALQSRVASDEATIAAAAPVLALAPYVSVSQDALNGLKGPNVVFNGVNLHVRDGSGATNGNPGHPDTPGRMTGLGNLVVGYNELYSGEPVSWRGGSNNLIIGAEHAYTSFGGFVAGRHNTLDAPSGSVLGGFFNTVSGNLSAVAGGTYNTGGGYAGAVAGGTSNSASGDYGTVTGGQGNSAVGNSASVSGGYGNYASHYAAAIGGGYGVFSGAEYLFKAQGAVVP